MTTQQSACTVRATVSAGVFIMCHYKHTLQVCL